uniref:Uncharacterized protein n=1 Tax=Leishmania guyanensis TaxID=5670 RepID=A0A1E1J200_LEIGU|nr:Hypothetical protein BN36_3051040 [Leishmania guyanensis]
MYSISTCTVYLGFCSYLCPTVSLGSPPLPSLAFTIILSSSSLPQILIFFSLSPPTQSRPLPLSISFFLPSATYCALVLPSPKGATPSSPLSVPFFSPCSSLLSPAFCCCLCTLVPTLSTLVTLSLTLCLSCKCPLLFQSTSYCCPVHLCGASIVRVQKVQSPRHPDTHCAHIAKYRNEREKRTNHTVHLIHFKTATTAAK